MTYGLLALAFLAAPVNASPDAPATLESLLPASTFLVAECSDLRGLVEDFESTDMASMLADGQDVGMLHKQLMGQLSWTLDLDRDEVALPKRMALSMHVAFDEDLGIEVLGTFAAIDFGDDVSMAEAIEMAMRDSLEDAAANFRDVRIRGRDVLVIEGGNDEPDFDGIDPQLGMLLPLENLGPMMSGLSTQYFVREGGLILATSDPVALDHSLGALDGARAPSLATNASYRGLSKLGPRDGAAIRGAFLVEPFGEIAAPLLGGPMAMLLPVVVEFFGAVDGVGGWAQFDRGSNQTLAGVEVMLSGERQGIFELLDVTTEGTDIPKFVPAEATSYSRINFNFKDFIALAKTLIGSLPEEIRMQIEPTVNMMAPMINVAMQTMGPEIHAFATPTDNPLQPTRNTIAIPTSNAESVTQSISMLAPMAGLAPRDFNGETVFSDPLDEFNDMAIGIGAGQVLVGDAHSVEAVLRSAPQTNLPTLGRTSNARRVRRALPSQSCTAWGMTDFAAVAKAAESVMGLTGITDAFDGEGNLGEFFDQAAALDEARAEDLAKHVGPFWWFMNSTDTGLSIRAGVLKPAQN